MNPPAAFPIFAVAHSIHAKPGERCPRTDIWIPEQGIREYSLAFCIEGRPMQPAYRIIGVEPDNTFPDVAYPETRAENTTWYFVSPPIAETAMPTAESIYRGRCESGQPFPREGYWFTPANPRSRRRFAQGEITRGTFANYGSLVWQWDQDQAP